MRKRWVINSTYQSLQAIHAEINIYKKSMQTPSCERVKTIQRTLFLSFENKNCWEKSGQLASHMLNSNNAIHSLPKVQISLGIIALVEKIYDRESILADFYR
jgi:hypothetical protein